MARNEGISIKANSDLQLWLASNLEYLLRVYHREQKQREPTADLQNLTGIEFETWLADLLRVKGYEVTGTPTTENQGADLVAKGRQNNRHSGKEISRYCRDSGGRSRFEVL